MSTTFELRSARIRFSGATHVGMKRTHNEDNYFLPEDDRLAIVADGMGGHASGEVASKIAVETLLEYHRATASDVELSWPYKIDHGDLYDINRLMVGIKLANSKIYERAQKDEECQGMGTTIVASVFLEDRVLAAHVGDSRLYRLRDGVLEQLTEDHSLLNDYVKMKRLTPEEVGKFPHKNVIVRALGMKESVQVDVLQDKHRRGDVYLLCSDGLSGMIEDPQMAELLRAETDLDRACGKLITTANQNGGLDNITCVLARVEAR